MAAVGWIFSLVLFAANVHAMVALSKTRHADKATLVRLKRRCLGSVFVILALGIGVLVVALVTMPSSSESSADRARFMAGAIAEGLNTAAFSVVACLLPLAAGLLASARARRAS